MKQIEMDCQKNISSFLFHKANHVHSGFLFSKLFFSFSVMMFYTPGSIAVCQFTIQLCSTQYFLFTFAAVVFLKDLKD